MAMNTYVMGLIREVSENNIIGAKKYVKAIINSEKSEKNKGFCNEIRTKLEASGANLMELPANVRDVMSVEDVSVSFNESRYYLSEREREIYENIASANEVNEKLSKMGIRYLNATMLYGESGTGKTTFGRYVAYKLGVPFSYLKFSHCVDSYLGATSKNIVKAFDYIKLSKCVFMIDEIDAIGMKRGGSSNEVGEMSRVVIGLMQAFDLLSNDVVLIGATNRKDILDEALIRRFTMFHEVLPLQSMDELSKYVEAFFSSIEISENLMNAIWNDVYFDGSAKQSSVTNRITQNIIKHLKDGLEV